MLSLKQAKRKAEKDEAERVKKVNEQPGFDRYNVPPITLEITWNGLRYVRRVFMSGTGIVPLYHVDCWRREY